MSNAIVPVVPKRNAVTGAGYPTSLALGELAVNTTTGDVYLGADPGVVQIGVALAAGTYLNLGTGTGSQVAFTIAGGTGTDAGGYLVSVGGVDQPSGWTVAGTTLTFSEPPPVGAEVSIRAILKGIGGGGTDIGGRAWSAGATYTEGDLVATSQRETWICIQNANTGHDPVSSPEWWAPQPADAVSLQLRAVSTATPIAGQILAWRNNAWTPWGHMFAHDIYWSDDQTLVNGSYLWLANFTDAVAANVSFIEGNYTITTNENGMVSKAVINNWYSDTSGADHAVTVSGSVTQGDEGGGVKVAILGSGTIESPASLDFNLTQDFTIEFFAYANDADNYWPLIQLGNGVTTGRYTGWGIRNESSVNLAFSRYTEYGGLELNLIYPFTPVTNAWMHIAVTRDSSAGLRLFVNGIQLTDVIENAGSVEASKTMTFTNPNNAENMPLTIGSAYFSDPNTLKYFSGKIAGLRVVNGTALYTSNFTVPITLPTAVSGTQLLLNFQATAAPTV